MLTTELIDEVRKLENSLAGLERDSTALAILPGVADSRLSEVLWQDYTEKVWVAGTRGDPMYTRTQIEKLIERNGRLPLWLLFQGWADHTPSQMEWVVDLLLQNRLISSLILSTASYHLPRCTLTFIKVWSKKKSNKRIKLALLPTSDSLVRTEILTSQSHLEEIDRIKLYQQKGDVATADEFFQFLEKNS